MDQSGKKSAGKGHESMDAATEKKDETVVSLAEVAGIDMAAIEYVGRVHLHGDR